MRASSIISHIVLSVSLVLCIITGFIGMDTHGVVPLYALLTLGASFVLGTQIMFIITGDHHA